MTSRLVPNACRGGVYPRPAPIDRAAAGGDERRPYVSLAKQVLQLLHEGAPLGLDRLA